MRILITGGSGLVGGRLGDYFNKKGLEVLYGTRNKINDLLRQNNFKKTNFIQLKWEDLDNLNQACDGVDVVIHAAGMNYNDCNLNPTEALNVNGVNTAKILNSSILSKAKLFIYLSTSHIYKKNLLGTITENNNTNNLHPYATSHIAGEQVLRYAMENKKINGLILRLSNSYGAPISKNVNCWTLLVNDLCRQAVENGSIKLRTNGLQLINLIPLRTVCKIVYNFLIDNNLQLSNGIFNIGSNYNISVMDVAKIIKTRVKVILNKEEE